MNMRKKKNTNIYRIPTGRHSQCGLAGCNGCAWPSRAAKEIGQFGHSASARYLLVEGKPSLMPAKFFIMIVARGFLAIHLEF